MKYDLEERTVKFAEKVIGLCKKEVRETKYWLRILAIAMPEHKEECRICFREVQELTLIFSKIAQNTN